MDYPEEATPLDPDELEGLKFPHVATRRDLDELEQANIESGLLRLARHRARDILTDRFAILLHQQLFGDVWAWAGRFRRTGKNAGIDPSEIGVALRTLMDDARYWTEHDTHAPLEAAARLHHRLVAIHPFANGNGRHARILADTVLTRVYGTAPVDWAGGHDLQRMNARRSAHFAALRAADRGDLAPLLAFVSPSAPARPS
jgi:Fic-DOC domain mobile mystery protein B